MKVKVDPSGRLYLPNELRKRSKSSEYTAELREDGTIVLKPSIEDPIEKYYGAVKAKHMEPEEMDAKIKEEVRKKFIRDDLR
jgi:bifunctional DNA-binding transcriptional regulator/antitoxin component of YhaV-PrlF toxin-antitoxin module